MKRENLWLWIAALSIAGTGWFLNLVWWCCRIDPCGVVSAIVPQVVGLGVATLYLEFVREACVFASLALMATGFVAEASEVSQKHRRIGSRS